MSNLSTLFTSCKLSAVTNDVDASSPIVKTTENGFKTTSFYLDGSGRASFTLPLVLHCENEEIVNELVKSKCLPDLKKSSSEEEEDDAEEDDFNEENISERYRPSSSSSSLHFQMLCQPENTQAGAISVEGVTVISYKIVGLTIVFDTEVVVRAHSTRMHQVPISPSSTTTADTNKLSEVTAVLQVTAILAEEFQKGQTSALASFPGSIALGLGGGSLPPGSIHPGLSTHGTRQTKLNPLIVNITLTNALSITVRSVSGSSLGSTLVSLTIRHSNKHNEPVTVTNMALHPRHSRLDFLYELYQPQQESLEQRSYGLEQRSSSTSGAGQHRSVVDMSKAVKWGYAPGTELRLPLTLHPNEAYATVLTIEAGENLSSHSYISPISINAKIGAANNEDENGQPSQRHRRRPGIVVSSDAQWTSGRVAIEPTDAFRVDMSVKENSCLVGAPVVVSLRVQNLSKETRDLMLLMAKDGEKIPASTASTTVTSASSNRQQSIASTAVVSEVNGYTFGVWGLSAGDDGTIRHSRDQELLAVDAALLLGEVKGQHSVDAELRFVPLREGTLDVPNLKLYDKREGKWYNCIHKLKITAASQV